jgi:hypothetical protein
VKSALFVLLAAFALAGCQADKMTLAQAQAKCAKTGGFLAVIYTQEVSAAGLGPEVVSPGDCIAASKFDVAPAPLAPAPSGAAPAPSQ